MLSSISSLLPPDLSTYTQDRDKQERNDQWEKLKKLTPTANANVKTEFPDNTANAKIIIGSVISTGIIMIFAFILILYYALNQKKKRKEMKNAAREVVLWAKRVTVTTDEQRYDNSNGSTEVQVLP